MKPNEITCNEMNERQEKNSHRWNRLQPDNQYHMIRRMPTTNDRTLKRSVNKDNKFTAIRQTKRIANNQLSIHEHLQLLQNIIIVSVCTISQT